MADAASITRRAFVRGVPAAGLAVSSSQSRGTAFDPFDQLCADRARLSALAVDDADPRPWLDEAAKIEAAMLAAPVRSPAGVAARLRVIREEVSWQIDQDADPGAKLLFGLLDRCLVALGTLA